MYRLYSMMVGIAINFVVGIVLYYEVIYLLFSMKGRFPLDEISYPASLFAVVVMLILCVEYNYNRYVIKVKERLVSKVIFWLTSILPLSAYTVFAALYFHK